MIITPEIWGPYGWKFIHMTALAYPVKPSAEEKLYYFNFFMSLINILPCHLCRDHYKQNVLKHPLNDDVLSSRETLVKWTIDMHNEVNIANNKKVIDYSTAIKLIINNYESDEKVNNKPKKEIWTSPNNIEKPNNIKKPNTTYQKEKNSSTLYILILIFISLIIIAVLYKKL